MSTRVEKGLVVIETYLIGEFAFGQVRLKYTER